MRTLYRYDHELKKVVEVGAETASSARVHVIADTLPETLWCPAYDKRDPKAYTNSKSKMRELIRAKGCYELGGAEVAAVNHNPDRPLHVDVKGALERARRRLIYKND